MEANRTQFTFYESFFKAVSRIRKKADKADAYEVLCAYALYGIEPDLEKLPDSVAVVFEMCKPNLIASRRKAENGKKGGAKKQTENKPKQIGSKSKQNAKADKQWDIGKQVKEQVQVQEKEQVQEQDKDKEQMLYIPPLPPSGGNAPAPEQPEVDLSGLSSTMQAKLNVWLAYKKERRESYKPTGLQALVTRLQSSVERYGERAVCELIDNSMSSGYQGILFDRLQQQAGKGRKEMVPAWADKPSQWAQDAVSRMMATEQTAGNDPALAERAEKLKERLGG